MIAGQVSLEKHMAARAIPLIFKDIGMELSRLIAGARQTMYFSNIGRITMPQALAPYVCQIDFFIPFNEQFKIAFKLHLLSVREFNLLLF